MNCKSFTLSARTLTDGRFEARASIDGKHVASTTLRDRDSLGLWLDLIYDEITCLPPKFSKEAK